MKLYYVANVRMPTEKAHGIQIAKMCEAFIESGVEVALVVPQRATDQRSLREYYGLRVEVPLVRLPALDWYGWGRFGYVIASLSFMAAYLAFLLQKKRVGEYFVLYTVDLDTFSSSALAFLRRPIFSEMHDVKCSSVAERMLFKKVQGIIAINKIIVEELQKNFPRSRARYLVEPNGVDLAAFPKIEKGAARTQLGLPQDAHIVLYAGRFFEWKGLEILPKAALVTPAVRFQIVGGDKEDFKKLVKEPLPANFFFAGSRPFNEMPLWYAAADALIVLGTKRDAQSYRYTSPMKLFEYLATGRPIIASGTPAIREIVSENEVFFYEPDNAQDLGRAVQYTIAHGTELVSRTAAAQRLAAASSWRARAGRIIWFIEANVSGNNHA
jgi:glycosyltransferase involved in cell wall biosynthesis